MQIIDVSNPSISKLISSIKTSGYSSDIALSPSGAIAYVAAGESGLQVIDISDVANPVPLSTFDTSDYAIDVTLSLDGKTAFVADSSGGLQIIDVSIPDKPIALASLDTSGYAMKAMLLPDSNFLLVANFGGSTSFQIIDISNLSSPSLIGGMFTSSNVVDFTLSSDGRTAFVVDYDAGLHIFDITNPLNPSLESVYNPSGTTQAITLSADGKTAFLSEDFEGIHLLNVSDPSDPSLIGIIDAFNVPVTGDASGFAVELALSSDGDTVCVANLESGLQLFDVSDLSSLIAHTGSPSNGNSSADDGDDSIVVSSSFLQAGRLWFILCRCFDRRI